MSGIPIYEWEKKVKYFIYDNPWPLASEMPIDSTAYESTYAAGRYALEHGLTPDENLWFNPNEQKWFSHPSIDVRQHRAFLDRQHAVNLACRGVLETSDGFPPDQPVRLSKSLEQLTFALESRSPQAHETTL